MKFYTTKEDKLDPWMLVGISFFTVSIVFGMGMIVGQKSPASPQSQIDLEQAKYAAIQDQINLEMSKQQNNECAKFNKMVEDWK